MYKYFEPFRILFQIGLLASLVGTLIWIPFGLGLDVPYPGFVHPQIMIGGFLLAFVFGFLMTALPNMTGVEKFSFKESLFLSVPLITSFLVTPFNSKLGLVLILSSFLIGIYFFIIRFILIKKKVFMPPFFPFVGFGFFMGVMGIVMMLLWPNLDGKVLLYRGMLSFLLAGIGSKLFPMIMNNGTMSTFSTKLMMRSQITLGYLGFILESLGFKSHGLIFQIIFIAIFIYQIGIKNLNFKTKMSMWIMIGTYSLLAGPLGALLLPDFAIHFHHLTFISGFGLLTIFVATRVVVAHTGGNVRESESSRYIHVVGGLLILCASTRLTAGLLASRFPELYLRHLSYAGLVWAMAIATWFCKYGKRVYLSGQEHGDHC